MNQTLTEHFFSKQRSTELPFVIGDTVRVLRGDYEGKIGRVDLLDTSKNTPQFLVDFKDGTDELIEHDNLELIQL